jgi:hypothetical protein
MGRKEQPDAAEGLVEPQGVNAGPPVDAEIPPGSDEDPSEHRRPPDQLTVSGSVSDEMVGLPEQRPGYPGQQRSMDTS